MVISDLVTSREIAANSISTDSWCSCIDGTLTKERFIDSIKKAGFTKYCLYKRFERIQRYSYWRYRWTRYFVFWLLYLDHQ
jgi:hypothetical protein